MKLCLHGSAEVNNGLPGSSKSRKKKICSKGIAYKASHNVKKSVRLIPPGNLYLVKTARVWGHTYSSQKIYRYDCFWWLLGPARCWKACLTTLDLPGKCNTQALWKFTNLHTWLITSTFMSVLTLTLDLLLHASCALLWVAVQKHGSSQTSVWSWPYQPWWLLQPWLHTHFKKQQVAKQTTIYLGVRMWPWCLFVEITQTKHSSQTFFFYTL